MVDLMSFIHLTREGNWKLHLEYIKCMLPWMFTYDRINYCCYLTIYLAEMHTKKHPAANEALNLGNLLYSKPLVPFAKLQLIKP